MQFLQTDKNARTHVVGFGAGANNTRKGRLNRLACSGGAPTAECLEEQQTLVSLPDLDGNGTSDGEFLTTTWTVDGQDASPTHYHAAEDKKELTKVLTTLQARPSCTVPVAIPDNAYPSDAPTLLYVSLGGSDLPESEYAFTTDEAAETGELTLLGNACANLQDGTSGPIQIAFDCKAPLR